MPPLGLSDLLGLATYASRTLGVSEYPNMSPPNPGDDL
jgi:hypothetical protein